MAMTVKEIREWLNSLAADELVAVDDGGLTLVVVGDERVYCEVGGIPEEEED